jgi:hypothetical protein
MVSVTQQTISTGPSLGHVTRPARALIEWMSQQEAQLMLAQRVLQLANEQRYIDGANAARTAVKTRNPLSGTQDVLSDIGPELIDHVNRLVAHPTYQAFAAEKWDVKVADLSQVIALQPSVFWDHAEERTKSAVVGDMRSLADITIPVQSGTELLPAQFDPLRNTWIISSRNPNLRIVGNFTAPVNPGNGQTLTGCGFMVTVMPSFVQVVRHKGRFLLRDGYHRSLGLLKQGIAHVPVLFREFGQFEPLGIGPGMLPEQAYLGDRPPFLSDYWSSVVSAEVQVPASQKMLLIQGIELTPLG